jgi:flagellar biosynthetic protein FlhB
MPDEDKHSRTEKPTARRRKEARHQGQVARTPEVITWLVILAGSYLVQHTVQAAYLFEQQLWPQVENAISRPSTITDIGVARAAAEGTLTSAGPAVVAIMVLALVANLAQTRGLVTFHPLKPTFSKLNPAKGLKRLISPKSAWDAAKQVVRVSLLVGVVWKGVAGFVPLATGSGPLSSTAIAVMVGTRSITLVRQVAGIGLVLAAADYLVQFRRIARQLRMTRSEIKEESKSSEGNPQVRGVIRRRQRQLARNRMIAAVASADAVVLNPTHFAVALVYIRGQGAPKVVAKGVDFLALRIREEAIAHDVTLVEDPPLARALYVACELEEEIPTELYEAVARLLTFIYSLKTSGRARRIDGAPHRPAAPLLSEAQARRLTGPPVEPVPAGTSTGPRG